MKFKSLNFIVPIVIIGLMYCLCVFSMSVSSSIRNSIQVCLNSIIPSMYGFMIVSDLLIRTDSHKAIGKVLSPIARYIFHLNGEHFAILLISLIAGYPVGAKLISSLEKSHTIDTDLAKNMYCYCYSGGLAFILGTIGSGSPNGLKICLIIYLSNIISNLVLAMILNLKYEVPKKDNSKISVKLSSDTLISSINSSFRVMVTICIMIISFSIGISLLDNLNITDILPNDSVKSILNAILEISNTSKVVIVGEYYIPIVSMIFSFGGICVIMQICSIVGDSFSIKHFLKCRLFTAMVSFILCRIMCLLFLKDIITVGYVRQTEITHGNSIVPSICLMFMSLILFSSSIQVMNKKLE